MYRQIFYLTCKKREGWEHFVCLIHFNHVIYRVLVKNYYVKYIERHEWVIRRAFFDVFLEYSTRFFKVSTELRKFASDLPIIFLFVYSFPHHFLHQLNEWVHLKFKIRVKQYEAFLLSQFERLEKHNQCLKSIINCLICKVLRARSSFLRW